MSKNITYWKASLPKHVKFSIGTKNMPYTMRKRKLFFIAQKPRRLATYVLVPIFEDSQVHQILLA
jgi:hypothetical protein